MAQSAKNSGRYQGTDGTENQELPSGCGSGHQEEVIASGVVGLYPNMNWSGFYMCYEALV